MNKNLTMAALGFTSGLPYMLIFSTLSIWLRDAGIAKFGSKMLAFRTELLIIEEFHA